MATRTVNTFHGNDRGRIRKTINALTSLQRRDVVRAAEGKEHILDALTVVNAGAVLTRMVAALAEKTTITV